MRTTQRPDPRSPFVLDTRELGRRPGSLQRVTRSAPAPHHLGTDVIGVREGTGIELHLRMEAVTEGVLVSGTAAARVSGECVRCLDDLERELEVDVQELFVYPGRTPAGEDQELPLLEGDLLDVEGVVRDAVVLALPFRPVCAADCRGLCPECGVRLADVEGPGRRHVHESSDPRWSALHGLIEPSEHVEQSQQKEEG